MYKTKRNKQTTTHNVTGQRPPMVDERWGFFDDNELQLFPDGCKEVGPLFLSLEMWWEISKSEEGNPWKVAVCSISGSEQEGCSSDRVSFPLEFAHALATGQVATEILVLPIVPASQLLIQGSERITSVL